MEKKTCEGLLFESELYSSEGWDEKTSARELCEHQYDYDYIDNYIRVDLGDGACPSIIFIIDPENFDTKHPVEIIQD